MASCTAFLRSEPVFDAVDPRSALPSPRGSLVVNALPPFLRVVGAETTARKILIVSAADARFMPLLKSLIASLGTVLAAPGVDLACFDIGLGRADREWLAAYTDMIRPPGTHLGVDAGSHGPALRSFLARAFLREYFPGYDVYVWIDSDIWLQDPSVVASYVEGALAGGMAVTHEEERAYHFQPMLFGWTAKHFLLGNGPLVTAYLLARAHVNAGFFALSADAPQWDAWVRRYEAAIRRTGSLVPHDQFALNRALHARDRRCAGTRLLDPACNWICARGAPMWDDAKGVYCRPYPPFEPIRALHLAGPAKKQVSVIGRTGGGSFRTFIVRGSSPAAPVTSIAWPESAPQAVPA